MIVKLRLTTTVAVATPLAAIALMLFPVTGAIADTQTCVVTAAQAEAGYPPSVQCSATVTQTAVQPGGEITVGGGGFVPGHVVRLTLHSTPIDLGTAVADARGIVSAAVTIPQTVTPGVHHITIFDKLTGRLLGVPITLSGTASTSQGSTSSTAEPSLQTATPSTTQSGAKTTASNSHSTSAIAAIAGTIVLVSAGAVIVVARRRVAG
jgi:hypothetical protein